MEVIFFIGNLDGDGGEAFVANDESEITLSNDSDDHIKAFLRYSAELPDDLREPQGRGRLELPGDRRQLSPLLVLPGPRGCPAF